MPGNVEWRSAMKEHECFGCNGAIPRGMVYQAIEKNADGRKVCVRLCERCAYALSNKLAWLGKDEIPVETGMFKWDRLNSKFKALWKELMATREYEVELLDKMTRKTE